MGVEQRRIVGVQGRVEVAQDGGDVERLVLDAVAVAGGVLSGEHTEERGSSDEERDPHHLV